MKSHQNIIYSRKSGENHSKNEFMTNKPGETGHLFENKP